MPTTDPTPAPLTWTRTPPTAPGWWWLRVPTPFSADIKAVCVAHLTTRDDGELHVASGITEGYLAGIHRYWPAAEWSDRPIPEPSEAQR